MSDIEFKLPEIGEGVIEGEIVQWLIPPGESFAANDALVEVITPKSIARLMKNYRATGECAAGLYLWANHMIVIRDLSKKSIEDCVHDLLAREEFESAFERLDDGGHS